MAERKPAASNVRRLSDAHKRKMTQGRAWSHAVANYLDAMEEQKKRRGRRRDVDAVKTDITAAKDALTSARPIDRVKLRQELLDLERELQEIEAAHIDMPALEKAFIKAVKRYSDRNGITYSAWRSEGVPAKVLQKAGMRQTRHRRVA